MPQAKRGRKSKYEEIDIARRYSNLSEKVFQILQERLESKSKKEQDWAIEQLVKGYAKMIPQQLGGINNEPIQVQWLQPSLMQPESGQSISIPSVIAG